MGLHWECQTTEAPDMAREFRVMDGEIWLGNRCVVRLRQNLPDAAENDAA